VTTRYFRRRWDESRADEWDHWGPSWWLFETDEAGRVLRQLEIYDRGPRLRYDPAHPHDQYGELANVNSLWEAEDWTPWRIELEAFEAEWSAGSDEAGPSTLRGMSGRLQAIGEGPKDHKVGIDKSHIGFDPVG
jgi:hypothetical protein